MRRHLIHSLAPLLGLLLFGVALWALHHVLKGYHYHDIREQIRLLSPALIFLALGLTLADYGLLTCYDTLSVRYIRRPLAYRKICLASFVGYAVSHNVGFSALSGAPLRYRFYSAWGLSGVDVAKIVAFNGLTFWSGFLGLGGTLLVVAPEVLPYSGHLPLGSARVLGFLLLSLPIAYWVICFFHRREFRFRQWTMETPPGLLSVAQVGVSALDWSLACGVLYVLLPAEAGLDFPKLLGIFLFAQVAGLTSQVPGGLGVFETVVLMSLPPGAPTSAVAGALLVYRVVYYLVPLLLAVTLLAGYELLAQTRRFAGVAAELRSWGGAVVPSAMALAVFVVGAILLFSGVTPAIPARMNWLESFLPLPFLELSHFSGSVIGVGLLILARGLQLRLRTAYVLTMILLAAAAMVSLMKGGDYELSIVALILLLVLLPCRGNFYREAWVIRERFTPGWTAAIGLVVFAILWLGVVSYRNVEFSGELWWQFAFDAHAPRFLRATVGVMGVLLLLSLARLFRPGQPRPALPGRDELELAGEIVARSLHTDANLALLGDKGLMFSQSKSAFLMYGIEGKSWVALGDPVGPDSEKQELVWAFQELSERYGGQAVFYEVRQENLSLYRELGLSVIKFGEEGRVPLDSFTLEGGMHKELRRTVRKLEAAKVSFDVISTERVPSHMAELREVSDAWLAERQAREKGFSLGTFDVPYIQRFPAAVVRDASGKIVAFANLWLTQNKSELSPDLMRFHPSALGSVIEYLFIQLMAWGKQIGYRWLNLGMAPLSGLEDPALAPFWNRFGSFLFRHGEHFYHFQGLRQFKQKFVPTWESKYLASPGGLALPRILTNLTTLIAGGLTGTFKK